MSFFVNSLKRLILVVWRRFKNSPKFKQIISASHFTGELIVDDISPYTKPERFEKLNELCDAIFISSIKLNAEQKTFIVLIIN